MHSSFVISPEVRNALDRNAGVVALESTIITHGMPYPQNLETARLVEQTVRSNGSVPATIAILNGKIHVGLSDQDLVNLASGKIKNVSKVSRRDISRVVSSGGSGSTTVSGTMIIAHMAGIRVFATGGIGGVHRCAESSWDVSADLTELGRTPMLVVCAGAKNILDLPKTIEVLETVGVGVLGYKTSEFPAFFSQKSGLPVSSTCHSEQDVANVLESHLALGLRSGLLLACPIPSAAAADAKDIERATAEALSEAKMKGVSGRDITPFLLKRIHEKTKGESLKANIALICNNAGIAARVAHIASHDSANSVKSSKSDHKTATPVLVIGGVCVDTIATPSLHNSPSTGSSYPGQVTQSLGGVGRNIARTIFQLAPSSVSFLSTVGNDRNSPAFMAIADEFTSCPNWRLKQSPNHRTAQYVAHMNSDGSLLSAVIDADGLFDSWEISQSELDFTQKKLVILDANLSATTLGETARHADLAGVRVWADAVSVVKCKRLLSAISHLDLIKVNQDELGVMVDETCATGNEEETTRWVMHASNKFFKNDSLKPEFKLLVSVGKHGAALVSKQHFSQSLIPNVTSDIHVSSLPNIHNLHITRFSTTAVSNMVNSTGAGDSFMGATAWAYILENLEIEKSVIVGLIAARTTLMSSLSVAEEITNSKFAPIVAFLKTSSSTAHSKL